MLGIMRILYMALIIATPNAITIMRVRRANSNTLVRDKYMANSPRRRTRILFSYDLNGRHTGKDLQLCMIFSNEERRCIIF